MPRRSLNERNIRNLTKVSNGQSYAVTIPIEFIKKLKWQAHQKLVVTLVKDRIIIKDWEK